MLGIVSIVIAAVYIPDSETSGTIILSTIGLIAIAAGVLALNTHRFGLRKRRGMAKVGITLGAIALISSAAALANVTWGTSIPTLADGTRWVTSVAQQAGAPSQESEVPVAAPERIPITEPPFAVSETPVFETPDDEYWRLMQELGSVVFLIGQSYGEQAPEALYVSPTGFSYLDTDGSVLVGGDSWIRAGFEVRPDGEYVITMTGVQFGTTAVYDSAVGVIERR